MVDTPSPYAGQERFPVTPASRHTVFRSYPNQQEMEYSHRQMERGWPHIRPGSVLVAAMGNHWKQGSWNRVIDMIDHTQSQGVYCALSEIQDRCFNPYDALGTMRNEAILTAMGEGFQYLCYIDNDVHPEKDTLLKIMAWGMPIVAPYIVEPGTGTKLFGPNTIAPNTGLQRAKWSVLSMLLFDMNVFKAIGPEFWRDALGADEGYHFMKLFVHGFQLYIDTATLLTVGGRPLYPLALNRLSSGSMRDIEQATKVVAAKIAGIFARRGIPLIEADQNEMATSLTELLRITKGDREIQLQNKIERFIEMPDRRPIDPASPWIKDGEYAPFLVKAEQAQAAQKAAAAGTLGVPAANGANPAGLAKALTFSGVGNG